MDVFCATLFEVEQLHSFPNAIKTKFFVINIYNLIYINLIF